MRRDINRALSSGRVIVICLTLAWLLTSISVVAAETPQTSAVRARLYWVNAPISVDKQLAPNQSPNVDVSLTNLHVVGNESWFTSEGQTYNSHYVLVLEATLNVEEPQEVEFLLQSTARATLVVDSNTVLVAANNEPQIAKLKLAAGAHRILLTQTVNEESRELELRWRNADGDFVAINPELLSAEDFYFRPTNSTAKRLETAGDRPGKFRKVEGVYPGVELMTLHPADIEVPVGGLDMLPDGRLVVATFDARRLKAPRPQEEPDGQLWLYAHVDVDDAAKIHRQLIAEPLYEPCGVCVVNEAIYVSQRDEITRFDYHPADGKWRPTTVATGWESNDFHALSFGLIHQPGPDDHPGYLYMARGTGLGLMKNPPNHGAVWRIDLSKPPRENLEAITGGHRTPNGIGFGPEGAIFVTDNQGEWTPANELNHIVPEHFYGFQHRTGNGGAPAPYQDRPTTPPAVMLPQDEIGNSPSEPALIPDGWPYAGQMIVGDVKYGGLNRIFLEKVGQRWQGCAFRFTQGLEVGTNRLVFANDGSLFVGGIGGDHSSTWNWVNPAGQKTYQGLQRLRPNRKTVYDLERVEVTRNGFRICFTQPIDQAWLADVRNYRLAQWRYEPTHNYGGPKLGEKELDVAAAHPSSDLLSVELTVKGRKPGHVVHFVVDPPAHKGNTIWSTEAWYTLWQIPQ